MNTELPERFELASQSPEDDRLNVLRETFPEVFQEGHVDIDALQRALGEWVEPVAERFGLTWAGKADCTRVIQEPSIGTLVPMPDESVDLETSHNVVIEGDNLEVLKLLQKAYYGQVKLIYIDPPYNTGNEFVYPDNFREGLADYLRYSGQTDDEGFKLSANAETDGRYHSKWLSMMYPRLFLARNLLREDGLIMVSIDDHEVSNLRAIMNEIFGEENFVDSIVWKKRYGGGTKERHLVTIHEYILLYARDRSSVDEMFVPLSEESIARYYRQQDENFEKWGPFRTHPLESMKSFEERANLRFPIEAPDGTMVMPKRQWRWSQERMSRAQSDGSLLFLKDKQGDWTVHSKQYLRDDEAQRETKFFSVIDNVYSQHGTNEILELFGDARVFNFPKPSRLIQQLVTLATDVSTNDLVLDFFAGSGSTGHAVLAQNAVDGGNRRFVLVQLPEPTDRDDYPTIAAICRERVRKAAKILEGEPATLNLTPQDLGFRAFSLAQSNFTVWDGTAESANDVERQLTLSMNHVTDAATERSMLMELMLKAGYPLTASVETVSLAGVSGYAIAGGALLICLSQELTIDAFEAMVEYEPAMILVLDAGFGGSDELKVNALQTVRARNQRSGSDIALRVV